MRNPDTVVTTDAYPVRFERIGGPAIESARVYYEVQGVGTSIQRERASLQSKDRNVWIGQIPQQPRGSIVRYRFEIRTVDGEDISRPARSEAWYQFHVRPLLLEPVVLPSEGNEGRLEIRMRGGRDPKGRVVARYGATARSFELTSVTEASDETMIRTRMPLDPGDVVDYHVEVSEGAARTFWPEGAPAVWASVKRSVARVRPVGETRAPVAGIAAFGDEIWLAYDGAGIAGYQASDETSRVGGGDVGAGLPSNQAKAVISDAPSGRLVVGTNRGLRYIHVPSHATVVLQPLGPDDPTATQGADPVVVSPLDGSIVFQLRPDEGTAGAPTRWRIFEDRIVPLESEPGEELVWEAGLFDVNQGCFVFAGIDRARRILVQRICGDATETLSQPRRIVPDVELEPVRVVALEREPASDRMTIILIGRTRGPNGMRWVNGLLAFHGGHHSSDDPKANFVPFQEGVEPTAAAVDDRHSRLLLGTRSHGIYQRVNEQTPFELTNDELLRSVTSLVVEPITGAILVGTPSHGFSLQEDGSIQRRFGPGADAMPQDALPMQAASNGRVLASSPSRGILELDSAPDRGGRPWPARLRWTAGPGDGLYGIAAYDASQNVIYIHDGRVLRTGTDGSVVLDGIIDKDPHSVFVSRPRQEAPTSAELWISFRNSYSPQKPGGRVHTFADGPFVEARTFRDEFGAMGDWIDAPAGVAVWAATRAGIVRLEGDLPPQRLSSFSVKSVDTNSRGNVIAVGDAIEAWDGMRFRPVPLEVNHPRRLVGDYSPGDPFDVAIDRDGRLLILFSTGVLVAVDREQGTAHVLDHEDGVPPSVQKVIYVEAQGAFFCGSATEGMVRIELP
jgi:hypothetical protein